MANSPHLPSDSASFAAASHICGAPAQKSRSIYWLDDQDHNQAGAGYAPYANGTNVYPVYRNVMDYSVVNDGSGDQTAKLQKAIDDDGNGGTRKGTGVTRHPAEVFLPKGVYQLGSTLTMTVGTIIVGDPANPPVIKAAPNFKGQFLIMGYDQSNGNPETSFMMLIKNVILDTTSVPLDTKITALQWGVAQGAGLTNVEVRMPFNSKGHTGIDIKAGSTIAVTDVVSIFFPSIMYLHPANGHRLSWVEPLALSIPTSKSISRISISTDVVLLSTPQVDGPLSFRAPRLNRVAQGST